MKLKDNYLHLLILICIAIFFVNLDVLPVNIMEARNFITAREMIDFNHWIFTTINSQPRYEKPPLPTWLTAISMYFLGMKSLFALRLPAAIMGSLTVIFIYKIGFKLSAHRKFAFISGLIAATSFYILYSGRDGQWDIHTHAWMVMAIYVIYNLLNETGTKFKYRNAAIAGLFIGCSFLSKGPVSMYTLLLPFLVSYGIVYKYRNFGNKWKSFLVMFLIAIIISASWSLYVYYFDTTAVTRITSKETGRWLDYNVRPFYYYWSFVIQSGIWTIPAFVGLIYPYLKNRVFNKQGYKFTFLWTISAVVLLSIIPEKKSRYLLPVLIPLALNTAFYIEYLFRRFDMLPKRERWIVYINFGIIAGIGLISPLLGFVYLREEMPLIWPWFLMASLCLISIGFLMIYYLKLKKIKSVFYLSIWFIVSIIFFGFPILKKLEINPAYKSIDLVHRHREKNDLPVFEYRSFTPELIWEYGKPIRVLWNGNNYEIPGAAKFLLLNSPEDFESIQKTFSGYSIQKIDDINMNPMGTRFRERLYRNLYILEKN